jgi:hypothetical protein
LETVQLKLSELGAFSKKPDRYSQFIVTYVFAKFSSGKLGVTLRAGLLAALKPRKRVSPLRAAIPDADGPNP